MLENCGCNICDLLEKPADKKRNCQRSGLFVDHRCPLLASCRYKGQECTSDGGLLCRTKPKTLRFLE